MKNSKSIYKMAILFIGLLFTPIYLTKAIPKTVTCYYNSKDLGVQLKITASQARLYIYQFGDDKTYRDCAGFLCASNIYVYNYHSDDTYNGYSYSQYEDSENRTCPEYIYVAKTGLGYRGYVSNYLNGLSNFMISAFYENEKYFGIYDESLHEDKDEVVKKCTYNGRWSSVLTIYENGKMIVNTKDRVGEHSATLYNGYVYDGENCPEYLLVANMLTSDEYYVSNNVNDLNNLITQKNLNTDDNCCNPQSCINCAAIDSLNGESDSNLATSIKCEYDDVNNCPDCAIEITFKNPKFINDGAKVYESTRIISGEAEKIGLCCGEAWKHRNNFNGLPVCPELYLNYDSSESKITVYYSQESYLSAIRSKGANVEINDLNCDSLFGNPDNSGTPAYYLSFAFKVIKYIAIVILIVLSIMDFISAVASQDNDALKKAMNKALTRFIICVIIFLLPILIEFLLKYINDRAIDLCINT